MMNDQEQMHPEDRRNMIAFALAAMLVWFVFDHYLIGPKTAALKQAREIAAITPKLPVLPREETLSEAGLRLKIDTESLSGSLALTGGRIDDISLKKYFTALDRKEPVVLFSPSGSEYPHYAEFGWIAEDRGVDVPGPKTQWRVEGGNAALTKERPVTLVWESPQGLRFERTVSVDDRYAFTIMRKVTNKSSRSAVLYPYSLIAQHGLPKEFHGAQYVLHEGPIGYIGDKLVELSYRKIKDKPDQTMQDSKGWIGIDQKYWFTSLIPDQQGLNKFHFLYTKESPEQPKEHFQVDLVGAGRALAPGETTQEITHLFAGAKELKALRAYGDEFKAPHMELAVDFGLYYFLTKPFFFILHTFGELTGNFGLAILMLTLIVRAAVFPLANTSFRSFAKMKKIGPQMKELREQFPDDKAALQEALVKLYEREKVNPMAGCLPIIIQIPIFFALYKVLLNTIEMRQAPFFGWVQDLSAPDPTTVFNLFGLLPYDLPSFLPAIGAWPCMMLFFMLLQQQLNPPPTDKTQAMMMKVMPFMFTFIFAKFAAGLVIYWTFSNALSVLQQYILMRSMGVPVYFFRKPDEEKKLEEALAEGPAVHPGIEMLEEKVEEALFGEEPPPVVTPPKPKKKKKR